MQNRYVGDIGDYVKYGLLRALAGKSKLGIAWYLFPDESHNEDGRYTSYLKEPQTWKHFDPKLFARLQAIVANNERLVSTVEISGLLPHTIFSNEQLCCMIDSVRDRRLWRQEWFDRVMKKLSDCDIIFADPDNGLCEDNIFSLARRKDWKRLPLQEAYALSRGRTAIFYHHNTRRKGGHELEIKHWMGQLSGPVVALRWRRFSSRTFLIVNPTPDIKMHIKEFAERWSPHVTMTFKHS